MIFLFPRWDMLIPWRVYPNEKWISSFIFLQKLTLRIIGPCYFEDLNTPASYRFVHPSIGGSKILRGHRIWNHGGIQDDLRVVYSWWCLRPQNWARSLVQTEDGSSHDFYLSGDRITSIYWRFNEVRPFGKGKGLYRSWGPKTITMVINHLQVMGWSSK